MKRNLYVCLLFLLPTLTQAADMVGSVFLKKANARTRIANATVTVKHGNTPFTVVTGKNGSYNLEGLPKNSSLKLSVSYSGKSSNQHSLILKETVSTIELILSASEKPETWELQIQKIR